jgi:hypothetical protein
MYSASFDRYIKIDLRFRVRCSQYPNSSNNRPAFKFIRCYAGAIQSAPSTRRYMCIKLRPYNIRCQRLTIVSTTNKDALMAKSYIGVSAPFDALAVQGYTQTSRERFAIGPQVCRHLRLPRSEKPVVRTWLIVLPSRPSHPLLSDDDDGVSLPWLRH